MIKNLWLFLRSVTINLRSRGGLSKFLRQRSSQFFHSECQSVRSPQDHFQDLELVLQRHAAALETEIRALQQADETAQWSAAWKQIYNWHFAQCFARQKIFRNWAADAAGWELLPERKYPNRGNRRGGESREEE